MNELNQLSPKKVFSKIGIILLLTIVITQGVQILLAAIINILFPNASQKPWFLWMLTVVSLYLVAFPIYLKLMSRLPSAEMKCQKKYSIGEIILLAIISLSATYVFNFVSLGVNYLIGLLKGSPVVNPLESVVANSNVIYTFVVACIMAPIVEEIMFRKVLVNKLVGYGEKTAIIISSFAFALFHGNLSQFFYAFALGYIFAYITIKSGTIKYSIILHVFINTLGSVVIPYFAMSTDTMVLGITGFIIILLLVTGILLFVLKRKSLFPALNDQVILEGQEKIKVSTVLLSEGMIAFWLISVILIFVMTFTA